MQTRAKSANQSTKSIHCATPSHSKTARAQSAPIRKECSSLRSKLETLQKAHSALKEEKRRLAEENALLIDALQVYYKNVLYVAIRKLYSRAQADQARCPFVPDQFIGTSTSKRCTPFPSVPPPTELPTSARGPWNQLFDANQSFHAFRILRHIGSHESNAWDLKQAILRLGPDVSTHLKDVARAGFTLVTGCDWDKADKRHRFADGDGLFQRALTAKKLRVKQTGVMVQQQMTAMSKAKFTFVCSKESGQVSYAPPSVAPVAEPSVTQIVPSEGRSESVSSSKSDSQSTMKSPSLTPEGSEAGTDSDMDLESEREIDQGEIIFVKMTASPSATGATARSSVAATTASTLSTSKKRKAPPEKAQSKNSTSSTVLTKQRRRPNPNPNPLPVSVKKQRTMPGSCAATPIDLTLPDQVLTIPVAA